MVTTQYSFKRMKSSDKMFSFASHTHEKIRELSAILRVDGVAIKTDQDYSAHMRCAEVLFATERVPMSATSI